MSKEIYISSTPHETRLAIVENDELTEIYYERENEYTLAGSIYNGKVTRVLPGMQSSFVDIGLERDAFLYITDFMEEAGDSAVFEANANGGDHARAPRQDGRPPRVDRADRTDRAPRTDRGEREALTRSTEPSDSDLFTEAVSGLDPARPVTDSERGERNGRRGGRNRRDRNVNSDGTPRRDPAESARESNRADVPVLPPVIIPSPDSPNEVGEGAPGADGSRRWRGRRGRRGTRGGAEDNGQRGEGTQAESAAAPASHSAATGPVYDAYPAEPYHADDEFDISGSAATEAPSLAEIPMQSAPRQDRGERGDRPGRNDRNRRDRGAKPPAPRVPRGFAPSASLYKVEGEADETPQAPAYGVEAQSEAPAVPIILPGESLSKYRAGGSGTAVSHSEAAPTAPHISDFVVSGWDGGMVLPGETIRPRGPVAGTGSEPRRESRGRDERGGRDRNDRGGRNDRGERNDRGPRSERPSFIPTPELPRHETVLSSQPAVESTPLAAEKSDPSYVSDPDHALSSHTVTPLHSTFVPPPPMPEIAYKTTEVIASKASPAQPLHAGLASTSSEPDAAATPNETEHEFEPSKASVSYRVDPAPPSKFRQSAPIVEPETVPEPAAEAPTPAVGGAALQHAPETPTPALPQLHAEHVEAPIHELTSINDTGEMHSESTSALPHELPGQEPVEPTSPIDHEAAVVDPAPYFAPGSGRLEEEVMEEEEDSQYEQPLGHIHASAEESDEPHDEETLEGAADLGTMIREMSIDQITRTEPTVNEDDNEEDFLEEDQDYEESDEDGDEVEQHEEEDQSHESQENAEYTSGFEGERPAAATAQPAESGDMREPRRDGVRRDDRGRREGRRGDRGRRTSSSDRSADRSTSSYDRPSGDRERSSERSGDRNGGRRDGRGGRQSMQSTNLPAISELLKPGQEILCQIAKEPIAKKGARITSHIALPGRFLVFMPTVSHTGVSRKIESDSERRRLKEILLSEKGEASGGFIVRTAAAGATEEELRSDLRFLLNLWADIKTRSESSKSPALIYHDLNLVERVLRDQVTDTFSAIWVDTETEYERVLRFLQRFQPSLIRRVKLYTKETPLFEQFGITEEINKALRSKVWLKSGGSIVINQTEALVAIDINTGKFVGKTARLEDTIVKTNLDAIPEIVRQIRLRDLGGIIIIDFIDMDERKNRNKVMAALEEELKSDRAPSKVLQFNDFGLVAITRKRVKQSLERTLSTTCGVCAGTGMVKSPVSVCNDIYIEMRKMQKHLDRGDVMLRVNPEVVKQLKSTTSRWLQEMEEMVGKTILVKSDPSLHPEQFDIH